MTKLTLLAAAALSCCTLSTTFAQVQVLRASGPAAASHLASDQTQLDDLIPAQPNDAGSSGAQLVPNPFDYFADELPQTATTSVSPELLPEEKSLLGNDLNSPAAAQQIADDSRANSVPVGRQHRHERSVVDTILEQATVGNVPHAASTPIYWGGAAQTPNPVADWLLREECVAGLWDGYPQQRAAECAGMWGHLSGHCGHCAAGCGQCAAGCGVAAGACNACAQPRVRNRYLSAPAAAAEGCAPCSAAPCESVPHNGFSANGF